MKNLRHRRYARPRSATYEAFLENEGQAKYVESFHGRYIPEPNSGCWLWTGSYDENGYGQHSTCRVNYRAHRYSWIIHRGWIARDLYVCHKCDNRACVNPNHLFAGTPSENTLDAVKKRRWIIGEQHRFNKLTAEQVLAIRADPRGCIAIGRDYGIAHCTVYKIKTRQKWKHLAPAEAA